MDPKTVLRFEDIALFGVATTAYFALGAPAWLFVVLALAPDLSMVGNELVDLGEWYDWFHE